MEKVTPAYPIPACRTYLSTGVEEYEDALIPVCDGRGCAECIAKHDKQAKIDLWHTIWRLDDGQTKDT